MRKKAGSLLLGKMIGLAIVLFLASKWYLPTQAYADTAPALPPPHINAINTVWTLVAAYLVFCMQVGFVMLESGFARSRETVNILVEGIADTCICGVTFWLWGFAFMFCPGTPWIGTTGFMLHGLPATYGTTGVPLLAYWVFQYAFADTCSTVTSGAMIGRCDFIGDLLYSVGVTGFIYPIIGHWAWGPDGWLANMNPIPFHDFAGSTVVHTIGGTISLAGAIALGPRLGRVFKRDGGQPMKPHDLIIGATGGLILWFGWYGFNPGSTLSALDAQGIGRVSFNTTLAACSAGLTALFYSYFKSREMGSRADRQRLPGRPGRDHLSLLLGRSRRRVPPRNRRGHRRGLGHRPARIPAHRRSDRRGSGAHDRRNLGHAFAGSVRRRQVRRAHADRRRHQHASSPDSSMAAASAC